jgi:PhoH-like ATPase
MPVIKTAKKQNKNASCVIFLLTILDNSHKIIPPTNIPISTINSKNISLNILNDRKILEVAKFAKNYYNKDIKFVSMDIMARTRAISLDIKSVALHGKDSE